ncbi:hypothetical protein QBC47DRAFT_457381 [Echria macrotheca]|uniref:Nucleoporin NUP49/NSP49 n=1 Tax=Echria macrotheca TaxID=438768 RepID=A0AAJ0BIQ8_9PEZI|nr:hypothetical protein QBC47DRAFT_457381 [Echria macrotheca]
MALARSASGPGGLSINTGSANLFGSNTSQPPPAGGLFGAGAATSQPAASGSLFGTTSSQPQAAGSLFGATATSQPQQSGSLFGTTNTQTATTQPQQTGGLFGQQAATAATQPQQTGGLFGTATAQPQQTTGGLFGGTATSQPQQTGGLFGNAGAQPQQTGGSLFGSVAPASQGATGFFGNAQAQQQAPPPQQQQQQGSSGGFGINQTVNTGGMFSQSQPARPQGGLFGSVLNQSTAQPQQTSGFGQTTNVGLTMGQSTNQQAQVVPGVRIDVSNIRSTTRFNDLHEDLQKQLAQIDEGIQKCIRDKEAVDAFLPAHGEQLSAIPVDVNFVSRKSEGSQAALSADIAAIDQLREMVRTDAANAKLSFKAVDNLKLPTQYHQAGLWSTKSSQTGAATGSAEVNAESNSDLISFFSKTADEMDDMTKKFEKNLGEIEVHLHGVQSNLLDQLQRVSAQSKNGNQGGADERVMELAAVLRDFEESILKVAGVVGGIKEGVTELQLKDFLGHGS